MRFWAGILVLLFAVSVSSAEKMRTVTVDGATYIELQDVHIVSGGRVVLLYASGGTTVAADKLSKKFLESWGIGAQQIAASKEAAEKAAEQTFEQAVHAGYFREVGGVVYDLRRAQTGWTKFNDAKVLQVIEGGALVDPTPAPYEASTPSAIFVRNLPRTLVDNDKAVFVAKLTGDFSYINKFGFQRTIRSYDAGRVCQINEIPESIVRDGKPFAALAYPGHPKAGDPFGPPTAGEDDVRAIGSGFFVTADGYFLTNFHVVREAHHVKIKYKSRVLPAIVVTSDRVNDLAVLKVEGTSFSALSISHKDSADLGDSVFTIGFPNITMQGSEPKYTDGKISGLDGMQDDPTQYQISVPVQPGNSGGPLCNANGEVVGIVVARLNDFAALRESGAVPQNVNYAVKARYVLHLLGKVTGVPSTTPALTASKPVRAVEDSVAMVMIY